MNEILLNESNPHPHNDTKKHKNTCNLYPTIDFITYTWFNNNKTINIYSVYVWLKFIPLHTHTHSWNFPHIPAGCDVDGILLHTVYALVLILQRRWWTLLLLLLPYSYYTVPWNQNNIIYCVVHVEEEYIYTIILLFL